MTQDLYNASVDPASLDWHEMTNLVGAQPARANQLAHVLRSWLASLPVGPAWLPNAGCQGFAFPNVGGDDLVDGVLLAAAAAPSARAGSLRASTTSVFEAHRPQDSDPDY